MKRFTTVGNKGVTWNFNGALFKGRCLYLARENPEQRQCKGTKDARLYHYSTLMTQALPMNSGKAGECQSMQEMFKPGYKH